MKASRVQAATWSPLPEELGTLLPSPVSPLLSQKELTTGSVTGVKHVSRCRRHLSGVLSFIGQNAQTRVILTDSQLSDQRLMFWWYEVQEIWVDVFIVNIGEVAESAISSSLIPECWCRAVALCGEVHKFSATLHLCDVCFLSSCRPTTAGASLYDRKM